MSLMGTLAKVAIGVAIAKGVGGMLKNKGGSTASSSEGGGGILGDLLKGAQNQTPTSDSTDAQIGGQGGLGDLLGGVLGGQNQSGGSGGGLGDLLEQLGGQMPSGNRQTESAGGGLGDLLGQMTGGQAGGAGGTGGLGDLLGGLVGGAASNAGTGNAGNGGSLGDIFNQSFQRAGEPEVQPTADQEAVAALMLRAMIQATKADGELDAVEQERLMKHLGDVSAEERAFVHQELQAPSDVKGLARQVPGGMEAQVYMMSVMAIDLDSQAEAQYLHQFAEQLGLDQNDVNSIHDKLGVQRLYS